MKRVLVILAFVCGSVGAQSLRLEGPRPTSVLVGRSAELRLVGRGLDGSAKLGPLPLLDGLTSRVEVSTQAPSMDAVVWTIHWKAWRPGDFEIPPLRVLTGGGVLESPPSRLSVANDPVGEEHVRIRVRPDGPWREPGRTFELVLTVEYDRAFFEENALQLFRRPLDVPLELSAPWWDGSTSLEVLPSEEVVPLSGPTLVVNGRVARARPLGAIVDSGREFMRLELRRRVRGREPGVHRLSSALARFAFATRFRMDFIAGRVPVERSEAFAWSRPVLFDTSPVAVGRPMAAPVALPPLMDVRGDGDGSAFGFVPRAILLLVLPFVFVPACLALMRVGRRTWWNPAWRRIRRAKRRLRRVRPDLAPEGLDAYREYLAARLGWETPRVVDPELAQRLRFAGLDDVAIRLAVDLMRSLSGATYGGGDRGASELNDMGAVVADLERAFRRRESAS